MAGLHKKGASIVLDMIDLVDNQSAAALLALLYSMTSMACHFGENYCFIVTRH